MAVTDIAFALKTLWPQSEINNEVYKDNPFLALLKKQEDFDGANMYLALQYADNTSRSHTFAKAQANRTSLKGVRYLLTRKKDYATAEIDTETIRASKSKKGSLVDALDAEMKSAVNALNRSMGIDCYGSGTGARGQVAVQATSPITMSLIPSITNIEVGMKLVASETDGSALRDAGAAITVTGVNRDAGTFTFSGSISGLQVGDFLYSEGDAINASTQLAMTGLAGWLPYTAPDSTPFMGVNRAVDTTRLAGVRMDISSYLLSEGVVKFGARIAREQGKPDYLFLDFEQFTNFEIELGSKVQYMDAQVGDIGFRGIRFTAGKQAVNVMPDQNCPQDRAYAIQMDTWKLYSLGPAPGVLNDDGNEMLRVSSADGVEIRLGYYAELGCNAPGWNGVAKMPV